MNPRTTPRLASLLLFASLSCTGQQPGADASTATNGDTPSLSDTPRLVVLCSVDQLASWVWREGLPHFADDGGFKRILREGVNFTNCAYEHGCTETGPGHATIGTGAPAAEHGIVRNNWWSPAQGAAVYCVGHLSGSLPGMLVGRNRGADRLLAETLADVMRAKVPGCKIGSVAWKDRSAILMVGKHADVAAWFEVTTCGSISTSVVGFQKKLKVSYGSKSLPQRRSKT
jgi:hypothetical protein